jgi:hypothetical protein
MSVDLGSWWLAQARLQTAAAAAALAGAPYLPGDVARARAEAEATLAQNSVRVASSSPTVHVTDQHPADFFEPVAYIAPEPSFPTRLRVEVGRGTPEILPAPGSRSPGHLRSCHRCMPSAWISNQSTSTTRVPGEPSGGAVWVNGIATSIATSVRGMSESAVTLSTRNQPRPLSGRWRGSREAIAMPGTRCTSERPRRDIDAGVDGQERVPGPWHLWTLKGRSPRSWRSRSPDRQGPGHGSHPRPGRGTEGSPDAIWRLPGWPAAARAARLQLPRLLWSL